MTKSTTNVQRPKVLSILLNWELDLEVVSCATTWLGEGNNNTRPICKETNWKAHQSLQLGGVDLPIMEKNKYSWENDIGLDMAHKSGLASANGVNWSIVWWRMQIERSQNYIIQMRVMSLGEEGGVTWGNGCLVGLDRSSSLVSQANPYTIGPFSISPRSANWSLTRSSMGGCRNQFSTPWDARDVSVYSLILPACRSIII